jgi:hypothetical protein
MADKKPITKKPYVVVRTYSAGVHTGELVSQKGKEVVLKNARRIWYWKGATSLSQLAMEGIRNPSECKFAQPVDCITLTEAIEIITCKPEAVKCIKAVPEWKS